MSEPQERAGLRSDSDLLIARRFAPHDRGPVTVSADRSTLFAERK